jgi:hypothetical protein
VDAIFVCRMNGLSIYRLAFGGYSVKCGERLIDAFATIEEAFRFCGM